MKNITLQSSSQYVSVWENHCFQDNELRSIQFFFKSLDFCRIHEAPRFCLEIDGTFVCFLRSSFLDPSTEPSVSVFLLMSVFRDGPTDPKKWSPISSSYSNSDFFTTWGQSFSIKSSGNTSAFSQDDLRFNRKNFDFHLWIKNLIAKKVQNVIITLTDHYFQSRIHPLLWAQFPAAL